MIDVEDILIFGFGLAVTVVVGSGLATMILVENRAVAANAADEVNSMSKEHDGPRSEARQNDRENPGPEGRASEA